MIKVESVPKYAASVILLRACSGKGDFDYELLMIKRAEKQRFLGGVHAFPGGKIEEADYSEENLKRCIGLKANKAYEILQDHRTNFKDEKIALSFWVAGIRELFEEVGILMVYKNGEILKLNKFQDFRMRMIEGKASIHELMEKENLYYAVDQLKYFRHFITPPVSPIRYDTRFFISKLPQGQVVDPFHKEITLFEWLSPKEALKKYGKREIKIIPPQQACLKALMKVKKLHGIEKDNFFGLT